VCDCYSYAELADEINARQEGQALALALDVADQKSTATFFSAAVEVGEDSFVSFRFLFAGFWEDRPLFSQCWNRRTSTQILLQRPESDGRYTV
jgi:hypothetical protein